MDTDEEGANAVPVVTLPPISSKPKTAGIKKKKKKSPAKSKEVEAPKPVTSPSAKDGKKPKEASGAHPAMIGVDMHPFHSELIDGLYKRPLVVSILIPKKRPKQFKYEPSKKQIMLPSDLFSSAGEESDGVSSKRPRSPDRPSSRQKSPPPDEQRRKKLKVFLVKVYDIVESKEAIYSVVVRDFDKLLEELIEEEKSFAVCDYYKPQSLEWWSKALRTMLIVFDKPNGELCVVVDKKLIRRMVSQKMAHHEWMDKALSPEQLEIQQKMLIDKSRKQSSKSSKRSLLRGSADMSASSDKVLVPWNDYTKLSERNAGASFWGPSASGKAGSSAGSMRASSSSIKALPPVRSAKTAPPRVFAVGEWVEANFKRAGQWFPGIVKKVHKDAEYYDIDYDDGRNEQRVEAKLVRPSAADKARSGLQSDALDLVSAGESVALQDSGGYQLPEDPSSYDYGDAFSPGATAEVGESFYDSSYGGGSYVEQSGDEGQWSYDAGQQQDAVAGGEESGAAAAATSGDGWYEAAAEGQDATNAQAETSATEYAGMELSDADYNIDNAAATAAHEDYDNHAYDYTNQAIISEDGNRAAEPADAANWSTAAAEEVADSADLIALENSTVERKVATPYVEEIIQSVLDTNYPVPEEDHFPAPDVAGGEQAQYDEGAVEQQPADVEEQFGEVVPTESVAAVAEEAETPFAADAEAADEDAAAPFVTENGENTENYISESDGAALYTDMSEAEGLGGQDSSWEQSSDFTVSERGSPGFTSSPSKIALASMLQALSLEESSIESGAPAKSAKKSKKKTKFSKGGSSKKHGKSTASILLGNSDSDAENTLTTPQSPGPGKKGKKAKSKSASLPVPEGLFKAPPQLRAKTASAQGGVQPPSIDEYVAAAAAVGKQQEKSRAGTAGKPPRTGKGTASGSRKKKKSATKSSAGTATSTALVTTEHTTTAEEILKDVPTEEDAQSVHSQPSLQSLHSTSSHHTGIHFTADSHGNFDHSHVPHYPLPHVSRADATKAALEAIHKPHSNPHDRYTYLMMPAPLHMTQIQHHHYGFGPKHDHHSHSDSHAGSHTGSNVASANVSLSGEQQDDLLPGPHTAQYARALSPDSLRAHNEQQQAHHHHHHGKELHIPHHEKDFYVSTAPLHTPDEKYHHNHHSEPSHFSETMHSHHHGEGRNTHSPSNMTVSSMGSATLTLPHIPGTGSRSRGTSPNAAQQAAHKDFNASTAQESTIVTQSSAAGTAPGSAEKRPRSKGSNKSPFANKDKYRGPQRRVLDIIEWARVSVGGPPKKQNRKMSEVEKRLLKSPLALKLIIDAPINVDSLIQELDYKR